MRIIFILIIATVTTKLAAQSTVTKGIILENGDTIPVITFEEVEILGKMTWKDRREQNKYDRLVRDIKITMPYVKLGVQRMHEIDEQLAALPTKRERDAYMKRAEEQLKNEFEADLKNLTFRQGKLLLKLVDRETGRATFHLIKEYRNGLSAFFWQNFARLFGMDLKEEYDPGKEGDIEAVIRMLGYD